MLVIFIALVISIVAMIAIGHDAIQEKKSKTFKFYSDDMIVLVTTKGDADRAHELSKKMLVDWNRIERVDSETGKVISVIFDNSTDRFNEKNKVLHVLNDVN